MTCSRLPASLRGRDDMRREHKRMMRRDQIEVSIWMDPMGRPMKRQRDLHRYLRTEPLRKSEPRIGLSKAELRAIAEQAIAARQG